MLSRRAFVGGASVFAVAGAVRGAVGASTGERIAAAARAQLGVTTGYDPAYRAIAYPNGDVPRSTGICADVVVRACRDALGRDLQVLVHQDMAKAFAAYPRAWGARGTDTNIDHRRVLNLQTYWARRGARIFAASGTAPGDFFGNDVRRGDFVTWLIFGRLPHVGVVGSEGPDPVIVNNLGEGVQEIPMSLYASHKAVGRYRWSG
ncbi:DUF1287 domain-containing protein [Terriglobus sp.]|uniref:DUF1287 domain-containing protein n=1 Tax=Terriglobus sp. TaxID=1889013 RepID=UPI003B00E3A9